MNFSLRNIIILVLVALTAIFLWQLYWLCGLYKTERTAIDKSINEAMLHSDFNEMGFRLETLKKRGEYKGSIYFNAYRDDDESSKKQVWKKQSEKTVTRTTGRNHKTTVTDMGNMSDSSLTAMLNLVDMTRHALHLQLDRMVRLDITNYDRLLTRRLAESGLKVRHRTYLINNDRITASAGTAGFTPDESSETYALLLNDEGTSSDAKIVLRTEPLTTTLLTQMAGILSASLLIMVVLAFVFWYLIRTLVRIRNLDEMKTDFSNNITHELKTPIAVALAANDALLNYGADANPVRRREYLTVCREQLERLGGMVEQILSMSMERRRNIVLNIGDVRVDGIISQLVHEYTLSAGKKVSFRVSIEPEDMTVRADPMHLRNILSNLIDNSVKYSGSSVEITITARKHDGQAEISVEDNGIGIAKDKLRYVFDRFYRVMDGNRYTVKGYGLGLFYVKTMTERMGGTVSVSSIFGKGTKFRLRF